MTYMRWLVLLLLLALVGCAKPTPVAQPAPPPIQTAPKLHPITPGPKDQIMNNCVVLRQHQNTVDCLCRSMSTKIDSTTGKQTLECKPIPARERR